MQEVTEFLKNFNYIDLALILGTIYVGYLTLNNFLSFRRRYKSHKKRIEELEAQKCEGAHEWMDMYLMGKTTHVCKKCNYAPAFEGYVKKEFVQAELERVKFDEEMEKFKTQRIEELAAKFFMEVEDLKLVAEEIISIKKDFTIQYLDKKMKEILEEVK